MKAMSMRVINIVAYLHAIFSFGLKWRIEKVDGNRKRLLPVATDTWVSARKIRGDVPQIRN